MLHKFRAFKNKTLCLDFNLWWSVVGGRLFWLASHSFFHYSVFKPPCISSPCFAKLNKLPYLPSQCRLKLLWCAELRFKEATARNFGCTSDGRPGHILKVILVFHLDLSEVKRYEHSPGEFSKDSLINLGFGPGRPNQRAPLGEHNLRILKLIYVLWYSNGNFYMVDRFSSFLNASGFCKSYGEIV